MTGVFKGVRKRMIDTDEFDSRFKPWKMETSPVYRASAHRVAKALLTHAESSAAARLVRDLASRRDAVAEATKKLGVDLGRHGDAHLCFTGSGFPYDVVADNIVKRFGDYVDVENEDEGDDAIKTTVSDIPWIDSSLDDGEEASAPSLFEPWTDAGATALRASARRVAEAVIEQAEIMITVAAKYPADEDDPDLEATDRAQTFRADEHLARIVGQHGDAQYDLTDDGFPFSVLARYMRRLDENDAKE